MESPFDDIAFLARSPNRVRVLAALSSGPHTRDDLRSTTDVSAVTVKRSVADLLERGWAEEVAPAGGGRTYRTTRLGDHVLADFSRLETTVRAAQRLGPVVEWLPEDLLDLDLRVFADAFVLDPDRYDPTAQLDRWLDLTRSAEHTTLVTNVVSEVLLDAYRDCIVDGGMRFEAVLSASAADRVDASPRMRAWTREMLDTDRATLYRSEASLPHVVGVFGDTVGVVATDDYGATRVGIESDAEAVREWARATYERYRADATPFVPTPDD
ncbi:helix-turn-helix transcriptional regulator [Halomarina rubra]|uniref:Helix-turn-helix transcriptional regulator n=1 Tax=Halomarina rubra TaxID=2071873 RepID=A0ABD6ASV5_9EURY|nr:hypothetical protein [Halomarina rubra]